MAPGSVSASCSISTPPCAEPMNRMRRAARSSTAARYSSRTMSAAGPTSTRRTVMSLICMPRIWPATCLGLVRRSRPA